MSESMPPEQVDVRRLVPGDLTDDEARALADWYTALSRGVAAFPAEDLKGVEPPLRSTPGPRA